MVNNLLIYFAAVLRAGKADSLAAAFAKLGRLASGKNLHLEPDQVPGIMQL